MERIAHRGAKRELPENTLPAFRRAFERGANAIELDVHRTVDGVVVVHHDPSTHSPTGALMEIARTRWADLQTVELAPGIGIPTLEQVLAVAPPDATVYVEIKGSEIEQSVADVLHGSVARCAVHSFDHDAIARLSAIAPEVPRGILFEGSIEHAEDELRRTRARDLWPHWKLVDADLVALAHRAGARVLPWTVNDLAVARRLVALGVDGLCGDDVRLFDEL